MIKIRNQIESQVANGFGGATNLLSTESLARNGVRPENTSISEGGIFTFLDANASAETPPPKPLLEDCQGKRAPRQPNDRAGDSAAGPPDQPSATKTNAASTKPSAPHEELQSDPVPEHLKPMVALLEASIAAGDRKRTYATLEELGQLAQQGDNEARRLAARTLDNYPAIWQTLGDSGFVVERKLISALSGESYFLIEATGRNVAALRASLSTEGDTPLEKLPVQRVVMAYLLTQHVDSLALEADRQGKHNSAWAKRQELAEKRYQTALKSLQLARELTGRELRQKPVAALASSPQPDQTAAEQTAPKKKPRVKPAATGVETVEKQPVACEATANCLTPDPASRPTRRAARKPVHRLAPYFEPTEAGKSRRNGRASTVVS